MKKRILLPFLLLCIGLLSACTTTTVQDMPNQPVPPSVTASQVQQAIVTGAAAQGWQTKVLKSGSNGGVVRATYARGQHIAVVDLPYSANGYSIHRIYTAGLAYDPKDNTIKRHYNWWIDHLNQSIQGQINLIAAGLANPVPKSSNK